MARFLPNNNLQQIRDEIIKGLQSGDMVVDRIDVRWDSHIQRYTMEIVDQRRSMMLSQWSQSLQQFTPPVPSFIPSKTDPVPDPEPAIKDLGVITEPIIGFRDFYLGNGPYPMPGLISRNKAPWPYRQEMRAFCRGSAFAKHDAPNADCECGIYAFASPTGDGLLHMNASIWGEIAMWGEVLIAPHGYRSEFAYPKTLFIQDTGTKAVKWLCDHLADSYGVPVFLVEKREDKTSSEIISELLAGL